MSSLVKHRYKTKNVTYYFILYNFKSIICLLELHFGTWQLTDEAIEAPVRDLIAARRAAGIDETTFRAPEAGETVRVTAG